MIVSLYDVSAADLSAAGAKAVSLARMKEFGLPIPGGFCIFGSAYREHIEGVREEIASALESLGNAGAGEKGGPAADIRRAIIEAPLSDSLRLEIENHYEKLGAESCAIRSSSTAEDLPGHSFAGQYDTFLDVTDLSGCILAIKKCWASLWTERAIEYRERNGFAHMEADMAVIVQEMVPADAAGVLFTADPVTGKTDRLVIEACFGLGEALVSGQVTPDRFVLARDDLAIISHSIAQEKPCIDEAVARRLGEIAIEAEARFGSPQDMEWAVRDGEIFFLQSRPITTLSPQPATPKTPDSHTAHAHETRQTWTNLNTGEVLPDVVTPVTWSMVIPVIDEIFGKIIKGLGMDFADNPIVGLVGGRVYFNLNTMAGMLQLIPGMSKKDITRILGGDQERAAELGRLEIPDEDVPELSFSLLRLLRNSPPFIFRAVSISWKGGDRAVALLRGKVAELKSIDTRSLSEDELAEFLDENVDELIAMMGMVTFAGMDVMFMTMLDKVCRKWLGDPDGTMANRLLAGMGGMQSAEAGLALWRLASEARAKESVTDAIKSGDKWEEVRGKLAGVPEGDEFLSSWDKFMAEHGHHTRGEVEFYNARWAETPDYILGIIRGYLDSSESGGKGQDPAEAYNQRAREREELEAECRRKLRNPIKRLIFNVSLRRSQRGSLVRENLKDAAVRFLGVIRLALLELGSRLRDRGVLADHDDIFFLGLDEIAPARSGEIEAAQLIAARRAEYDKNLTITPPQVVIGAFDPDDFVPDKFDETAKTLHGVAVSSGVAVGPARVILRASADERVQPGEILVAPFTDPGWTPYFIPAAAIVMDMGGILSHGSIVAREYGIPAVVNVGPATKIIKTGQMLRVDGDKGVVEIER
jgi:pyruvate,water dikinase